MTVAMNVSNYIDSLASPCNNALSCAVYIQVLLNGVTVVAQVLLVLHNRVQICDCLNRLTDVRFASEDAFSRGDINMRLGARRRYVVLPVAYNATFTLFTVVRCVFMFALKPKTPLIQMVQLFLIECLYFKHFYILGSVSVHHHANTDRKPQCLFNTHRCGRI